MSLANHLFVKYDIPDHLFNCWDVFHFYEYGYEKDMYIKWYIKIAQGESVRKILPIKLTKKQAHLFMQAPRNLSFEEAVRWAQITSMKGDKRLINAVFEMESPCTIFCHRTYFEPTLEEWEHFWLTSFQFFINHPMLDRSQYRNVIDYVIYHKFGDGTRESRENAPLKNFEFANRSPLTLLDQVEMWHKGLETEKIKGFKEWEKSSTDDFLFEEGIEGRKSHKIWRIRELLNNRELRKEGRAMHHCVFSYVNSCKSGRTSIWSLTLEQHNEEVRCVTVEMNIASKKIIQIQRKYNKPPSVKEKEIIKRWVAKEGLKFSEYLD